MRAVGRDRVGFAHTAQTFRTDRSGGVEVVLRTPRAAGVVEVPTRP